MKVESGEWKVESWVRIIFEGTDGIGAQCPPLAGVGGGLNS